MGGKLEIGRDVKALQRTYKSTWNGDETMAIQARVCWFLGRSPKSDAATLFYLIVSVTQWLEILQNFTTDTFTNALSAMYVGR